jgi:hypothetical protein
MESFLGSVFGKKTSVTARTLSFRRGAAKPKLDRAFRHDDRAAPAAISLGIGIRAGKGRDQRLALGRRRIAPSTLAGRRHRRLGAPARTRASNHAFLAAISIINARPGSFAVPSLFRRESSRLRTPPGNRRRKVVVLA